MALTNLSQITTSGISTLADINLNNITGVAATFTGNVTVGGTLTYDDVTNIDSVGLVTARSGVNITGGDLTLPDAIIHAGDTNTKIRFPAADTVTIETGGTEAFKVRTDQRVQITSGSAEIIGAEGASAQLRLTADEGDEGADYWRFESNHSTNKLNIATYITGAWVDKVTMTTGGNVGIGITNPEDYGNYADDFVIYNASQPGMTLASGTSGYGSIYFADGTVGNTLSRGQIQYGHSDDYMAFATAATERLRITAAGNVGIGLTNPTSKLQVANGHINLSAGYSIQWSDSHERIEQSDGKLEFFTANGEKMVLSGDNLGLGASNNTSYDSIAQNFLIANESSHAGMTIRSGGSGAFGAIHFADGVADNTEKRAGRILYGHGDNFMGFHTANAERLRITSNGGVLIGGHTTAVDSGNAPNIEIVNTSTSTLTLARNDTSISSGHDIAAIRVWGNDSNGTYQQCAEILAEADGDHGTDDKPTALSFKVTADGASSPTERLRIDSAGNTTLGYAGSSLHFQNGFNNSTARIQNGGGSNNSELKFLVRNAGTESEKMRLTSTAGLAVVTAGSMPANAGNETLYVMGEGHTGHGTSNTRSVVSIIGALTSNSSAAGIWMGARTNDNTAVIGTRTASGNLAFETYSGGWGERMRLTSGGNLGINRTNPDQKLNVSGNIEVNAYDSANGSGGYYTAKGLIIGNLYDAGKSYTGSDDRTGCIWQERGLDLDFATNDSLRMKITYDGQLIHGGVSNPAGYNLVTGGSGYRSVLVGSTNGATAALIIDGAANGDGSGSDYASIEHNANGEMRYKNRQSSGSNGAGHVFYTTNSDTEKLRITSDGHKFTNEGSIFHGSTDITDFTGAGRNTYNNVSIRAGYSGGDASPTNRTSAIKIYPVGTRNTTAGTLTGGIAWQHLDPNNGSWSTAYGEGAQIWMGAAIHDVPGQERDRFNLWMNSSIAGNSNPNNLAIEAYPSGVVRHPKVPAFMVRHTTSANWAPANSVATWNTIILNNGNHWDSTNNRWTAPVPGIYHFTCQILSNNNSRTFHYLRLNGVRVDGTSTESYQGTNYQTVTFVATITMSANDNVDVYIGTNGAYGSIYSNFNGFLVG